MNRKRILIGTIVDVTLTVKGVCSIVRGTLFNWYIDPESRELCYQVLFDSSKGKKAKLFKVPAGSVSVANPATVKA